LKAGDVLSHLQKLANAGCTHPGIFYNQAIYPTQAKADVPKPRPKRTHPEVLWKRAFDFLRNRLGRIPTEAEVQALLRGTQLQASHV
jgi:hypothetical protein